MSAWCLAFDRKIVGEYSDARASGKNDNRPGLQNALSHVCKTRGLLLVYKLDRIARNAHDALGIAKRLEQSRAFIASIVEGFDTSTDTGRLFYKLLAVLAEWEREQSSKRTSDLMRQHQATGRIQGRHDKLPYGFREDPDNQALLIPDEREQQVIEKIQELRAQGLSLRKVGEELDAAGFVRREGQPWANAYKQIDRILKRVSRMTE